jgi:hypothetical protein
VTPPGGEGDSGAAASEAGSGAPDGRKFASGWWKQYKTLFGRELLSITRNPFDVAGRTLTFCWVGAVMGILYYGMPVSFGLHNSINNQSWHWVVSCCGGAKKRLE